MFDPVTSALVRAAPPLPGLAPENLTEELTAAYVEIASARLSLAQADALAAVALSRTLDRMARLADTYEGQVVLGLDGDRRRATAFVAASARQVVALAVRLVRPDQRTTRLDETAIGAELASALLFLIAERSSDAYEAARDIQAAGEPDPVRRALILAVSRLAKGQLRAIVDMAPEAEQASAHDPFGYAAYLLFRELLFGVVELAREGLGLSDGGAVASAVARFERVKALALHRAEHAAPLVTATSTFAGPHHLASLLLQVAGFLGESALVKVPAPSGSDAQNWEEWLRTEAERWPYLWENHRRAIETGYLNRGESLVMTSPTGSGKTTLAALKIAAIISSGRTVLYLAPTHALVGQVERDLNKRVGALATAESVDDTLVEEILPALPTLAVVTPERCFALLTFAPELFANVGLLVFDECHLLGIKAPEGAAAAPRIDRRGVDAMLCLLTFLNVTEDADLLLLSAMVSNGPEVAKWLQDLIGRPVHAFDDRWKPTRQLRCCVTYDRQELLAARQAANAPRVRGRRQAPAAAVAATPHGLFSLTPGWNPGARDKLLIRPLSPAPVPLGTARRRAGMALTANRFEVAAAIADRFEQAGLKVIIFCDSITTCVSTARKLNLGRDGLNLQLEPELAVWRGVAVEEVGDESGVYDASKARAAVHHGELLPEERRLAEALFSNPESGVNVLAATSTLAQGLNLPCEVVILAGTDRVDDSDPEERGRTPLMAHEILNALGRAGRAGQAATGLAIVVPGDLIGCDPGTKAVNHNGDLEVVFSAADQCLPLGDPLTALFDRIEVQGVSGSEAQYLLRRLSVSLAADREAEGFEALARRTFGYHQRRRVSGTEAADAWLTQRRATLVAAIQAAAEPPAQPWEEELAAKTGGSRRLIVALAQAYQQAPTDAVDASVWLRWLLDQLDPEHPDMDAFLRPETLARVFGRACTNAADDRARRQVGLQGIRTALPFWFGGRSLLEIEAAIADFVAANEGAVSQPTRPDARAKRARRFALRLAPDLGFLAGVLTQVGAKLAAEGAAPPMLQFLPQLVRRGFETPYHFALSRDATHASRVAIQRVYAGLEGQLERSPNDEYATVLQKLSVAQVDFAFDEVQLDELLQLLNPPADE